MKRMVNPVKVISFFAVLFIQSGPIVCQTITKDFPVLKGPYFGQTSPGDTAKIFARDLISVKGRYEFGVTSSPAGNELLVGTQDKDTSYIIYTRETNTGWTKPKRISLSNGRFTNEMEPFFTPDGKQIFFAPFNQWDGIRLWRVVVTNEGWKDPKILNEIVAAFPAFYPNCSRNKTLYYSNITDRKIYMAKYSDEKYNTPELAGLPFGFHCFISPDESFALIDGGPDGIGKSDIYIVFRNLEGKWNKPIKLGPQINSEFSETCPALSHDGRYIFFSRYNEENEVSDIYWVSAKFIKELKPKEFPVLKGKYLGQKIPGSTPEIFTPGIVSTSGAEHGSPIFSPDGNEIYWFSFPGPITQKMSMVNEQWTAPETVKLDGNPTISPDGKKIFFNRREPGRSGIGYCERTDTGWSEKKWVDPVINNANSGWEIWMTKSGTIYFSSTNVSGSGGSDICKASLVDGKYTNIENLGPEVNSAYGDWGENGGFVAPDESYLIFSSDRPGGFGGNDLYICFRKKGGLWTSAVNMGSTINNSALQLWPYVSPDGKFLFFITHENGTQDIYWVSAKIIEELRLKE